MLSNDYVDRLMALTDTSATLFNDLALELYDYQRHHNLLYARAIGNTVVDSWVDIPCLPITFFKEFEVKSFEGGSDVVFESSGTTGSRRSQHFLLDTTIYQMTVKKLFREHWAGNVRVHIIGSASESLELMFHTLCEDFPRGTWLDNISHDETVLNFCQQVEFYQREKPYVRQLLFGTTYSLWEFTIVMRKLHKVLDGVSVLQTGGLKGRDYAGMTAEQVTQWIWEGLTGSSRTPSPSGETMESEYSMSELSSQLYGEEGLYWPASTMKFRVVNPVTQKSLPVGDVGVIQFYDLANVWSCGFIQTEDVGRITPSGTLQLLGRAEGAVEKGCSLSSAQALERVKEGDGLQGQART